jgi:hypothetical protein
MGCFIRRAAFFTGVRLGLALATARFAALDTLRVLRRLFPLGSFPRFCTFDRFLRLAMIVPLVGILGIPLRNTYLIVSLFQSKVLNADDK